MSTLTYLFFLKKALEARFFGVVRKVYLEIAPGVVLHPHTNKFHCPYGVQFFFNVGVGVLARILSMVSLFLISFVPYNPVFLFASFYHNLPLTCNLAIVLFLYAKPAIVDGLVFIVTDKILKRVQKEDCEGEEVLYSRMGCRVDLNASATRLDRWSFRPAAPKKNLAVSDSFSHSVQTLPDSFWHSVTKNHMFAHT